MRTPCTTTPPRRRPWMRTSLRASVALGLFALLAQPVLAQGAPDPTDPADPADPAAAPAEGQVDGGDKKELAGKKGFSFEEFERQQLRKQAAAQERIHKIRMKKITTLTEIVQSNRPYSNKASVLFRLAEAHWNESKYQYFLAREEYDKKADCFEEKRCSVEPVEPVEDFSTALNYYRQVLRQFPDYDRIAEVKYYLGRAALQSGKSRKDVVLQKEGVKQLQQMIQQNAKSRLVPDGHLLLAEHFFDTDNLYYAKTNYEKIINNYKQSAMFNYALYKLGWVYFNLAEFDKTIETFKQVVAAVGTGAGTIEFREQALNDLVVAWSEVDGGWESARAYFLKAVGEEDTYSKLDKMAGLLVSKDRDPEAVALYNHLIDHDKVSVKALEYLDALLEIHRKVEDSAALEAEINRIAAFLEPTGAWYTANKADDEAINGSHEMVATNVFFLANTYHRDAQKLEDQKKPAKDKFIKAAEYYKKFLDRFPDHPDSYKLNFFYAEILFDELKDYDTAAEQYEKVINKDKKGEFVEDAALGVIYAIERKMVDAGIIETSGSDKIVLEKKKDDDFSGDINKSLKPIKRTDLVSLEKRFINAADAYVNILSAALKDPAFRKKYPKKGEQIPAMMFIAAQVFYRHGQFKDAVERLMVIFDLYPKHRMASLAVGTIIECYARLKHWEKIETWARQLISTRNFLVLKKAQVEDIIAFAKNEHAKDLMRQRRYDEAIRVQEEIVEEFGRKNSDLASKALYNVAVIHEQARRFPDAVATYERVIKRFKNEQAAIDAQFAIASLFEAQTQFAKAAAAFIEMAQFKATKDDKKRSQVRDAIRNAGLIYEALEQYESASKTFNEYVKIFRDADDASGVAFHGAEVLGRKTDPLAHSNAAKGFEKVGRAYGRKDVEFALRATSAAGIQYKKADKDKNRRKAEQLFRKALTSWNKVSVKAGADVKPLTKAYAAMAALELAEYAFDDYAKLTIEALSKSGRFDMGTLRRTLLAKAGALKKASKAFVVVLGFKDPGMAAAAAFRNGQLLYEFAESLFNAPVPPGLTEDQVDDYKFALEEVAAPFQEQALIAFTAALKNALEKNVYNKWSRMSAKFAAKVNPDEFPVSEFRSEPNKTKDTIQSTSFIQIIRRGNEVVDFSLVVDPNAAPDDDSGDAADDKDAGQAATVKEGN